MIMVNSGLIGLSPHDALKHHLTALKTDLVFYNQGFYNENFHETDLPIHRNFLIFFTHIKSFSFTTSRELRQQFTACSGRNLRTFWLIVFFYHVHCTAGLPANFHVTLDFGLIGHE